MDDLNIKKFSFFSFSEMIGDETFIISITDNIKDFKIQKIEADGKFTDVVINEKDRQKIEKELKNISFFYLILKKKYKKYKKFYFLIKNGNFVIIGEDEGKKEVLTKEKKLNITNLMLLFV